jgi:ferredoxin
VRVVITEDCAGTGQCVAVAPDVFELNGDGLSTVIKMPDTAELTDAARSAADLCPMAAIQLEA